MNLPFLCPENKAIVDSVAEKKKPTKLELKEIASSHKKTEHKGPVQITRLLHSFTVDVLQADIRKAFRTCIIVKELCLRGQTMPKRYKDIISRRLEVANKQILLF